MPTPNDDLASGVGQGSSTPEVVTKYDQQHGEYKSNVPRDGGSPNLPNLQPAGPNPSPFKVGGG